MKKLFALLFSLSILIIACSSMDTKKIACEEACKSAYEECKKDAEKSKKKLVACEVARDKCFVDCSSN